MQINKTKKVLRIQYGAISSLINYDVQFCIFILIYSCRASLLDRSLKLFKSKVCQLTSHKFSKDDLLALRNF